MDNPFAKILLFFSIICLLLAGLLLSAYFAYQQVVSTFGSPDDFISTQQRIKLTMNLFLDKNDLLTEHTIPTEEAIFSIGYGESVISVADRFVTIGLYQ